MQGLYYLFSLIGFGVIALWFIKNDHVEPGATTGLLRMRGSPNGKPEEARVPTTRVKPRRRWDREA
jgi:hypothetical protein